MPASQARRATLGSPPKRSATRRARSIGSAWKSCHPTERAPWLLVWRWRTSSAAMAKRSDRHMPVISGASSVASGAPSRPAGRPRSAAMSSNAMIVAQRASLTTPAATVTVPNARGWRGPSGIFQAQTIRGAAKISTELRYGIEVRLLRRRRQIADRHVLDHSAAKRADLSHRNLLSEGLGCETHDPLRQEAIIATAL